MGPPMAVRLRGGGLKAPCNLDKWNTSVFLCSTTRPNLMRRDNITL